MATVLPFIHCRTCGRYILPQNTVQKRYCSKECTAVYIACVNCGRYFQPGSGYQDRYCSEECSVHFKLNRIYGPEPFFMLSEEFR